MDNDKLTLDCSFRLQEIERLGFELDQEESGTYVVKHDDGIVFGENKGGVIDMAYKEITGNDY